MAYRILLTGGGSGGHVFPLIAVANALKEKAQQNGQELELLILGDGRFIEKAAIDSSIPFKRILTGKLRRYFSLLTIIDIFKIPIGFFQSLWHMFWFMPDVIFAKGGYASLAPSIIGRSYFIPLFIHESDSIPGLANRILGKLAKTVFISFQSAEKYFKAGKTVLIGNPLRKELIGQNKEKAIEAFQLNPGNKTILVLGGSQGAQKINDIILQSLVLVVKKFQLIHQCGETQYNYIKNEADKLIKEGEGKYADDIKTNYRLFPFLEIEQLGLAYAAADILISRSGGGSIFEISAAGKPVILIPITDSSADHQLANAREFSRFGAVVLEEQNLTPHILINQIESLLNEGNYAKISANIKTFAKIDAADKIADTLITDN
ncbi:MAG: hypothetical protein UU84_C0007G0002 [Candidatus Yanofskybacteria bacterium GW2011_GWC2_41_9]|uniref:UDP-N-acetylglucosamine--N-acetylmuramyl-(pentapeptide) pyrophosphoryl-undecaprenol N-acetylglucosamine transferase n=1 Tax=Candidatus Yanofskybacteria bacterium GW2011_GWC2_41_9 TaxID=1619029 RepID=A0A0G0XRD4_9BACT|nr:MAG: hypothetical protein UU84_C0007G0002 [Candidatus Yanofskybacteria bacterium GW2011_GWC2_41_9]